MSKSRVKKNTFMRMLVFFTALVLIAASVSLLLTLKPYYGGEELPSADRTPSSAGSKAETVLIAVVDDNDDGIPFASAVLLANADTETGKVSILQLPGNTYVGDKTKYGMLGGAYNWGYGENGTDGVTALAGLVCDMFAVPVDHYVVLDGDGVRKFCSSIGEFSIQLDEELTLNESTTLGPGIVEISADEAEAYLLNRSGEYDGDALMTVQEAIETRMAECFLGMDVKEMLSFSSDLSSGMECDYSVIELLSLFRRAQKADSSDIIFISAPGETVSGYGKYGLTFWSLDRIRTAETVNTCLRAHMNGVLLENMDIPEAD